MINKRGKTWIWILVILLILIIIGVIAYVMMSGDTGSVISGGNSISQPPALPN